MKDNKEEKTKTDMDAISYEDYCRDLKASKEYKKEDRALMAFEKAWEIRNFEINMYWKRATYFWAFIASSFAGYLLVSSAENPNADQVFILTCVGLILSFAWFLTNKGSKSWQRHWENHVDLLEDDFTGPLYKTVFTDQTYSVSKINEIVSASFSAIWVLLLFKVTIEGAVDLYVYVAGAVIVSASLYSMAFGRGRGRFSEREVTMFRRKIDYK